MENLSCGVVVECLEFAWASPRPLETQGSHLIMGKAQCEIADSGQTLGEVGPKLRYPWSL